MSRAAAGKKVLNPSPVAMVASALAVLAMLGVSTPPPASAKLVTVGLGGWQVQSSAQASQGGAQISEPGFPAASWLQVRPDDGGAVGTEVGALVQNGRCPGVFFSTNIKSCFGYMSQVGPDTIPMFAVPWWFRTTFASDLRRADHAQLIVNGVVGEADVWLNGQPVASRATVQGAFTRYSFDITRLVRRGANGLALKLYPNNPNTMFTLDNVDWTQIPPDNNTGIQFPIQLHASGPLGLSNAHVVQRNARDLSTSALTLKAEVTNNSPTVQVGAVSAAVKAPSGATVTLQRMVRLPARSTRTIEFGPAGYPALLIRHPQVWWPYAMGAQPLYRLMMSVSQPGSAPDSQAETFGIRTVTTRLVGPAPIAPNGSRRFAVNGRPFVFRGGGWSEDLFLRYSAADTADQIALIKNLGLNGIRTEGKQMPDNFYAQMDRAGILVDGGFQCCDAWQLPDNGQGITAHDYAVLYRSAKAIGENLRNHPSVMNFSWSDNQPIPGQETVSLAGFRQADFQEPLIASAEYKSTPRLGPSGEKEGPYDWVPPAYWYDTAHYDPADPTRTNVGGAWGFDSEASSGAHGADAGLDPPLHVAVRTGAALAEPRLQPVPRQLRARPPGRAMAATPSARCHDFDRRSRAATASGRACDYVQEAQVQNYENTRAQFEALHRPLHQRAAPSTGASTGRSTRAGRRCCGTSTTMTATRPAASSARRRPTRPCTPCTPIDNGTVTIDNLTGHPRSRPVGAGKGLRHRRPAARRPTASGLSLRDQGVATGVLHPRVPAVTVAPTPGQVVLRRARPAPGRPLRGPQRVLAVDQAGRVELDVHAGQSAGHDDQYGDLTGLKSLKAARSRPPPTRLRRPGRTGRTARPR